MAIGRALAQNSSLTYLNLAGEQIEHKEEEVTLSCSVVIGNTIGPKGGKEIGRALTMNSTLLLLDLGGEDSTRKCFWPTGIDITLPCQIIIS